MMLSCHDLVVSVDGKPLCQPLTWQANAGECWALLGQNGVGKTSLLLTLAGLASPGEGEVRLHGQPLQQCPLSTRAKQMALLLQEPEQAFPASVLDTVLIGRHPYLSRWQMESADDIDIAMQALQQVGLADFAQRNVQTLSGGERRRVQFAQLLAQQTPLLLLDEPVNHLDIAHQLSLMAQVQTKVQREQGIALLVLHDVNLALRFCDRALLMFADEILHGPVESVITAENLQRLYGCAMERAGRWYFPA
ncbi:MAG: ABC transporter ATP-binding protein [Gammaproteobacteria bacterium]|nr:ABC transporter ATP-binding protein [Gammaproteobacteria bacterium]